MDLASLRFTRPDHPAPAPAGDQARLAALLADYPPLAAPFDGVMAIGSFNTGVAGSLAERPAATVKRVGGGSILRRR